MVEHRLDPTRRGIVGRPGTALQSSQIATQPVISSPRQGGRRWDSFRIVAALMHAPGGGLEVQRDAVPGDRSAAPLTPVVADGIQRRHGLGSS